ncbi:MAG: hypothetical protein WD273_10185 [Trueperaceae bacterium]
MAVLGESETDSEKALQVLRAFSEQGVLLLQPSHWLAEVAAVVTRLNHHLFDTLYHAVTLSSPEIRLVTADERYYKKAALEGQIIRLSEIELTEGS